MGDRGEASSSSKKRKLVLKLDEAKQFCSAVMKYGSLTHLSKICQEVGGRIIHLSQIEQEKIFHKLLDTCRNIVDQGYIAENTKKSELTFFRCKFQAHPFFDQVDRLQLLEEVIERSGDAFVPTSSIEDWTTENCKQLLVGITKYGFGNWDQIQSDDIYGLSQKLITTDIAQNLLVEETDYYRNADIDWFEMGFVANPFAQGTCGCCWAVSPLCVCASRKSIKENTAGNVLVLSPAQLVDCERSMLGCGGGHPIYTLRYMETHQVFQEQDYPYEYRNIIGDFMRKPCRATSIKGRNCQGYTIRKGFNGNVPMINRINEELSHGPITIEVNSAPLGDDYPDRVWDGMNHPWKPEMENNKHEYAGYGDDELVDLEGNAVIRHSVTIVGRRTVSGKKEYKVCDSRVNGGFFWISEGVVKMSGEFSYCLL